MSINILTDLAVLGIAHQGPITTSKIAVIAKSLVPELWSPTIGVIDAAVRRNLQIEYLAREKEEAKSPLLKLTETGHTQIQKLLLCDPGDHISSATQAVETVQFCFLDAASRTTAEMVLTRLQNQQKKRLKALRDRCRNCPHEGRYMKLWMGTEQRRLAAVKQMLAIVSVNRDNMESTYDLPRSIQ
tara:strand:- start:222 stop:779 length:558 start_codon:yes stop_codon:yes gene_type:complete